MTGLRTVVGEVISQLFRIGLRVCRKRFLFGQTFFILLFIFY